MRDAEDRVAAPKPLPPPEVVQLLPEAVPTKPGFKSSLNTSVNKLLNIKPAPPAEAPDQDAARVRSCSLTWTGLALVITSSRPADLVQLPHHTCVSGQGWCLGRVCFIQHHPT